MATPLDSFFDCAPAPEGTERFDPLFAKPGVLVERIVSSGCQPRSSFCQPHDEWVMLLRGHAELVIDGRPVAITEGQMLTIPAGVSHEVVSTSAGALWLAVHVGAEVGRR